jgi:hypothetical protein
MMVSQVPAPCITPNATPRTHDIPLLGVSSSSSNAILQVTGGGARDSIFTASCLDVSLGGGRGRAAIGSRAAKSWRISRRT